MKIKAKPTQYKGVEFRSRLEARFAEMLDKTRIDWEYEPETFLFGTYQPDFYLPNVGRNGLFVEIKPQAFIFELEMFWPSIWSSSGAWVCVDKAWNHRSDWVLLRGNAQFDGHITYSHYPRIEFVLERNKQFVVIQPTEIHFG